MPGYSCSVNRAARISTFFISGGQHQRYCWTWELRNKFIKITRMESEHILFEIPCGLCYFTQFEHKLGTLLLGEWGGFTVQIVHLPHKEAQVHWMTPEAQSHRLLPFRDIFSTPCSSYSSIPPAVIRLYRSWSGITGSHFGISGQKRKGKQNIRDYNKRGEMLYSSWWYYIFREQTALLEDLLWKRKLRIKRQDFWLWNNAGKIWFCTC